MNLSMFSLYKVIKVRFTKKWHFPVALVCVILGILLALQVRIQRNIHSAPPSRDVDQLALMLKKSEESRRQVEDEVKNLKGLLQKLEADDPQGKLSVLTGELKKIRIMAGLVALRGKGVIVQPQANPSAANTDQNFVTDEDLLKIVNELWAGGAEAIAVNDQRLIASSEIRIAGDSILVNGNRISEPFVIKAIGNPEVLEKALRLRGGPIETLEYLYKIEVQIDKAADVTIPAFNGSKNFDYAKPVEYEKK